GLEAAVAAAGRFHPHFDPDRAAVLVAQFNFPPGNGLAGLEMNFRPLSRSCEIGTSRPMSRRRKPLRHKEVKVAPWSPLRIHRPGIAPADDQSVYPERRMNRPTVARGGREYSDSTALLPSFLNVKSSSVLPRFSAVVASIRTGLPWLTSKWV